MRSIIFGFLFLYFFCACNQNSDVGVSASENDADAARNFIQAALDGDYKRAKQFVVPDSVNQQYIELLQRNYESRMSRENKKGYKEASINIHSVQGINDSVSIIQYSNSYKKQRDSIKAVRIDNKWLVDLKYSFPSISTTDE
jgi:type IV secretory pathway component VirB8